MQTKKERLQLPWVCIFGVPYFMCTFQVVLFFCIHPIFRDAIVFKIKNIYVGEGNLIEEQSEIVNRCEDNDSSGAVSVMIIGNNNVFEVSTKSHIQSLCRQTYFLRHKLLFIIIISFCCRLVVLVIVLKLETVTF